MILSKSSIYLTRSLPLAAAVLFLCTFCVVGQTPTPTPTPGPDYQIPSNEPLPTQPSFAKPLPPMPDQSRIGVETGTELSLTLQDAIEMALKNNNDIDASRQSVHIADFAWRAARGIYDPFVNSQTFYETRTTPTASTIGGAVNGSVTQKQVFNDLGVSGFVPKFGGSYDVVFNQARTNTSNRNATLNPQFPTNLVATFTQPLWRNRSIDANRRNIMIAGKNVNISESQLRQRAMDIISTAEQAYWDLYFALRNLQVQVDTLKQARDQLESNKRQADKGVLAPIDIVQAQAQVSTFEQNVYAAQETVTRNENTLKTLLLADRSSPEWSRPLTPITPAELEVPQLALELATAEAIKSRPEIEQLEINQDINRIDQKFYRNQTKPQIDLVSSYTSAGLAGTPNPLSSGSASVPDLLRGGYTRSITNLLQNQFPTYRAGIQIGFPIFNRTAKANLGSSIVRGQQLENNRAQAELNIEAEVRNSLQALRSAESRLRAATDGREAAEQIYESEQRQFRGGLTTYFLVLQRQTELATARGREVQARTDLNKAISEFNRSIGRTLAANSVEVSK
ncbi:MAG TPA: TolC family protein [Pyrinomonadaceae bacterium]|nr:TolC family protein [Pyrinomonadaceae bacterium]